MQTEKEKKGQPTAMRKTIADIADEIRRAVASMGDEMPYTVSAGTMRWVADRIEAALKSEREDLELCVTRITRKECWAEYCKSVGNSAAMREALESVDKIYDMLSKPCIVIEDVRQACQKARAVLISTPLRNCDVGTAEEQYRRWIHFCERHLHRCDNCPCNRPEGCTFTFENMPYKKEGGAK